jgi:pilus assembly protein Flp/PilA
MKTFFANRSGATAIEYGILAAMIALAIVTAIGNLGGRTTASFQAVTVGFE